MTNDISTHKTAGSLQAVLLQLICYAVGTLHATLAVLLSKDMVQSMLELYGLCVSQEFKHIGEV